MRQSCTPNLEYIFVELRLPNARKILVGGLYRQPDASVDAILDEFDVLNNDMNMSHSHDVLYLGDMNIDFNTPNMTKSKLLKFLKSYNLSQLINHPTRITIGSSTCIDHVYCNNSDLYSHRGTLDPGLSDHNLVFVCRKRKPENGRQKEMVWIRNYRHFDPDLFSHDISTTDWSPVFDSTDVNTAVECFNIIYGALLDKHMPWKCIKTRIHSAPWITGEFLSLIDAREFHTKNYNKCPCEHYQALKKQSQHAVQCMKN